jgi:predicted membrane chloride channel (bestrophin family)
MYLKMKFLNVDYILALLLLIMRTQAFAPVSRSVSVPKTSTSLNLESLEQKTPDYDETAALLNTYSEKSRAYRRNVFSAADWVRARRSDRFISNILTTLDSGLIRQLSAELTFITLVSLFLVTYNVLFVDGFVDLSGITHEPLVGFLPALQLPITPFSLSSGALGLLLTFRTNVSYSRWNEARTAWGAVINDSRSITRMGCIWSKSYKGIDDDAVQRLGEAVCSFSRSLMNRTLPPQEDEENFKKYTYEYITDQNYAEVLRNAKHRPTAALAELTSTLVDFRLNPLHQVEVEKVVTGLCDALGASERIFTSPVPPFYSRHTARFLAFWLLGLPMGLYSPMAGSWNHWAVIPATVFIGGFLLGIEELATQMEEPFSILPMEKMCEGSIRTAVMEQVERSQMGVQSQYYGNEFVMNVANPNSAYDTVVEEHFLEEEINGYYEETVNGASIGDMDALNKEWAAMGSNSSS